MRQSLDQSIKIHLMQFNFKFIQKYLFVCFTVFSFTGLLTAQDCQLSNLVVEKSACTSEKTFYVTLNFGYKGNSECFYVQGNGVKYGQFKYSQLPLKIGPLKGDCTTIYEFVVRDCANEKCNISTQLGTVCCESKECMLSELNLVKSDCNADGNFYVTLKFAYKNVSDCFNVQGNGVKYGQFKYSQLPIKIGPLKGNCETPYEFLISDCANERCNIVKELGVVCCEQQTDCKLYELETSKTSCDSANEFYVKINFKYKNNSDSFDVTNGINKKFGRYAFAKLPVIVGPFKGDCNTKHILEIVDYQNPKCFLEKEIGIVCCEQQGDCKLSELKFERSDCNENKEFYVSINFGHSNTSECFTVQGNGQNYGTFQYSQLPIKIGPLKGNCETNYEFVIRDCKNEKCALDFNLGKVCCETQGNCEIGELILTKSECNQDGNFRAKLDFKYANVSDCFVVVLNGKAILKGLYNSLPIDLGLFPGDCITEYNFVVYDCNNERCANKGSLGKVCCGTQGGDCKLGELKFEKSTCNENKEFYISINFGHANTSDCFTVQGNGQNYGTFLYSQLPIKIGPLKGNCETNYSFVIRDCKNEKCALEFNVGKVCCETQGADCKLGELKFEKSACNENKEFYISINFGHANTSDCFTVQGNGQNYGTFQYSQLPIKIGPLKGNCETNYSFVIRDCKNERCALEFNVGKVCCETQGADCKLGDLKFEKSACNENKEFYVSINFAHANTSDCFTVQGNGQNYGTFQYSQLPIKIGPLNGNCETNYSFVIRDCKNERCALEFNVGKVCCEQSSECMLSDLEVVKLDCNGDGLFNVKLNFKYKNVSECFIVRVNNTIIGKYKYSSLPLQIGPFKGNCLTNYNFAIYDCEKESCRLKKSIGRVCCPVSNGCMLSDLKLEKSACEADKTFYVYLKFSYKNTSECFTVQGNGVNYGTFKYGSLPIKIGPLKGNCETNYSFVVRDCKNERCALEGNIGKVCCETPGLDCKIFDFIARARECSGVGQYVLELNFKTQGTKGVGFDLYDAQGNSLGFFNYNTLPLTLKEFKASGNEVDYLKVCENDNEKCCAETKFVALKCITNPKNNFELNTVYVKQSTEQIIIHSDQIIPSSFFYSATDITGREFIMKEISRSNHDIILSTNGILEGMYIVRLQNIYEYKNIKFIK